MRSFLFIYFFFGSLLTFGSKGYNPRSFTNANNPLFKVRKKEKRKKKKKKRVSKAIKGEGFDLTAMK
jgi:hypothetical protein